MLESPFLSRLKSNRVRLTGPRRAVLCALEKEHVPLSAKELWALCQGAKSDLVSIYRILDRFEKEHIVDRVELGDGITRFELARAKHHHHARCESCGLIQDIGLCIEDLDQKVKQQCGFELRFHDIQMMGLCAPCAKKNKIKNI